MTLFHPRPNDALLVVDMQNDFLPGGTLPVPEGDLIIPAINQLSHAGFSAVIASQDWHPAQHMSFAAQGGPWPPHCVAGSQGANLHPKIDQTAITHVFHKGMMADAECYSAFADENGVPTGLTALLTGLGIRRLILCGVALDYCVRASAFDSHQAGFNTVVLPHLCRAISAPRPILDDLKQTGISLTP
ncbi:isochorismatase family protein [Saccharibacter sp. 17.LH.SD]|uniref:isochorismatase family protein n=1 Tax=Saccharibacter sp. 17.LH.SD TaxID=2689393 RepID=UPI00136FB774|nr:isochorismatase family protein [Saccharibacter sp. 17.LH.SD]MXV44684.1 isochorismatase family protein [Saccharibacter sp. 17.LH.SD]